MIDERRGNSFTHSLIFPALFALLACLASYRITAGLGDYTLVWDPASHGLKGVALAHDIKTGDVPHLLHDVVTQKHYPPTHSLLQAPLYLVLGYEPWAGVLVSIAAFFFLVLLLALIARELSEGAESLSGYLCVFWAATSVYTLLYANLIMLEIFGAFGVALCVYCRLKMLRSGEFERAQDAAYRRWAFWTGISTTVLMLTASNFGLLWIVTLFLYEFSTLTGEQRRGLLQTVRNYLFSRKLRQPLNVAIILLALLFLYVYFFKGFRFDFGKWHVSLTATGPVLYFALIIIILRIFYYVWKNKAALKDRVPVKYQAFFLTVVIPLFLWFFVIYPPRFKTFFDWLKGRSAGKPFLSEDFLLYYPQAILNEFHITPTMGWVVLTLFAISLLLFRHQKRPLRFLQFTFLVFAFFTFIHHARDARFLVPLVPLLWCIAAHQAAALFGKIPRWGKQGWFRAALVIVVIALCVPQIRNVYGDRLREHLQRFYKGGELPQIFRYIVEKTAPYKRVEILGDFGGMSHHLFEWEHYRQGNPHEVVLDFDIPNPRDEYDDPAKARAVFDRWLERESYDIVVVLEPDKSSPYYEPPQIPKDRWNEDCRNWMAEQQKYTLLEVRNFLQDGVQVQIYGPKQPR